MRRVNDETLALIKRWEGLRLEAYRDTGGVWTIGYGHTASVRPGQIISEAKAERLLREDLATAERAIERLVKVPLTDAQFGALVSWAFNVGEEAAARSTLVRKLNAGDYSATPAELMRWNKDNGRTVAGLTNRRAAEAGLWSRGSHVSSAYVTPQQPPAVTPETQGTIAAVTALATPVAPLLAALADMPQWLAVAIVVAVAGVALAVVLTKRRRAVVA